MKSCPRDSEILASNDVDGYRYYSCGKCHGFWISGSALRKTMRPEVVQDLIGRCSTEMTSTLVCPGCDSRLVELALRGCAVDICPRCHSIWLDQNEAQQIAVCFRDSSPILEAEQSNQAARPILTGLSVVDGVLQLLTLLAR